MANTSASKCPMCEHGNKAVQVQGEMMHITDGGRFRSMCIAHTCAIHKTPLNGDGDCIYCPAPESHKESRDE